MKSIKEKKRDKTSILLDIRYLRVSFLSMFAAVQMLDGISTVVALRANSAHYETNPIIRNLLEANSNMALVVMLYEILTMIAIVGILLIIDKANERVWKSDYLEFLLKVVYISGFILLVIWRIIFAVVPNFYIGLA